MIGTFATLLCALRTKSIAQPIGGYALDKDDYQLFFFTPDSAPAILNHGDLSEPCSELDAARGWVPPHKAFLPSASWRLREAAATSVLRFDERFWQRNWEYVARARWSQRLTSASFSVAKRVL